MSSSKGERSGEEVEKTETDKLIEVIQTSNAEEVRARLALLPEGVIDGEGNTLYHEAASRQDLKLLRWLLTNYQSTVPSYQPNKNGVTCFHLACGEGKTPIFQALWSESKIQPKTWCKNTDSDGHTGLHIACLHGHQEVAREIIRKLKEEVVYDVNKNGQTSLHIAAAGGHMSCVRLLVYYKKLINAKDSFGATPLHYAVNGGHIDVSKYLLERCKAITTGKTQHSINVVHAATASGNLNMLRYMMGKTSRNMHVATTASHATVLHIATGMGHESTLEYLLLKQHVYPLVNVQDKNGWTAAHLAALRNHAGCLAILIGYNADIHVMKDKHGLSAYQVMCDNETASMRKTFPELFDRPDVTRTYYQPYVQTSRYRSRSSSKGKLRSRENGFSQQNGYERKRNASRIPSLSASQILNSQMDFTKTNPLAQDGTPNVQQRRFLKHKMALPNKGQATQVPSRSYFVGRDEGSDDDFHIDDIDQIPETPLRTIQQFNDFRHSTYTPTQSTEDLTKVDVAKTEKVKKTGEVKTAQKHNGEAATSSQIHAVSNPSTGGDLPIIMDYSKSEKASGEGITIYFHNGALNTVKVKTSPEIGNNPEGTQFQSSGTSVSTSIADVEVHKQPETGDETDDGVVVRSSFAHISPSSAEDQIAARRYSTSSNTSEPLPPPPPPPIENAPASFSQANRLPSSPTARMPTPPPYTEMLETPPSPQQPSTSSLLLDAVKEPKLETTTSDDQSENGPSEPKVEPSKSPSTYFQKEAAAWPAPIPYVPRKNRTARSMMFGAVVSELNERSRTKSEAEENNQSGDNSGESKVQFASDTVGMSAEQAEMSVANANDHAVSSKADPFYFEPINTSLQAGASTEQKLLEPATEVFSFETLDNVLNAQSQSSGYAPVDDRAQEASSSKQISSDETEREYLKFAGEEIGGEVEEQSNKQTRSESEPVKAGSAGQMNEPNYAVIVKKRPSVQYDQRKELVRVPSNISEVSDSNLASNSSTAYKFNYHAYKKKISAKDDTAADLFEYNPTN